MKGFIITLLILWGLICFGQCPICDCGGAHGFCENYRNGDLTMPQEFQVVEGVEIFRDSFFLDLKVTVSHDSRAFVGDTIRIWDDSLSLFQFGDTVDPFCCANDVKGIFDRVDTAILLILDSDSTNFFGKLGDYQFFNSSCFITSLMVQNDSVFGLIHNNYPWFLSGGQPYRAITEMSYSEFVTQIVQSGSCPLITSIEEFFKRESITYNSALKMISLLTPMDIEIYGLSGQLLIQKREVLEADLSHLPSGMYIVQLESEGGYSRKKIVIP